MWVPYIFGDCRVLGDGFWGMLCQLMINIYKYTHTYTIISNYLILFTYQTGIFSAMLPKNIALMISNIDALWERSLEPEALLPGHMQRHGEHIEELLINKPRQHGSELHSLNMRKNHGTRDL